MRAIMTVRFLLIALLFSTLALVTAAEPERHVIPAKLEGRLVDGTVMQQMYDDVKTPFKYGVILKGAGSNELVDCPSVFRRGEHWYLMYVAITNKVGYQTFLARSDDLLHWTKLGKILPFSNEGWDAWQADGGIALADYRWEGTHELEQFDGRYWLSYIGGAKQGYETDPLSLGMAWTREPAWPRTWTRLKENPVLSPRQPDARSFETKTLYKSQIIHDTGESLGWPFVMFYNAKYKNGFEQIGMAVSRDMVNWTRYGTNSVLVDGEAKQNGMSGDPQIVKIGDVWVSALAMRAELKSNTMKLPISPIPASALAGAGRRRPMPCATTSFTLITFIMWQNDWAIQRAFTLFQCNREQSSAKIPFTISK